MVCTNSHKKKSIKWFEDKETGKDLDLSGVTLRMVTGLLFAIAEMELENIRERQAAGITSRVK